MSPVVNYACELISFDSVSSKSNVPVTDCLESWLKQLDCTTERVDYIDAAGVSKTSIVAKRGTGQGGLGYFGHSDVVPAHDWRFTEHGPFDPVVKEDKLFGRGSTDMKGSLACFLTAMQAVPLETLTQSIYFCCTADEEVGMLGAASVVKESELYREMVTHQTRAIIGEPTQFEVVHGHKGGCGIIVTSHGRAAHSSTKDGINANWKMIPFLADMKAINEELESSPKWRNPLFRPQTMTMNLGINDLTTAINITPPQSICTIYLRQMPGVPVDPIVQRIEESASRNGLDLSIAFRANPFYVEPTSSFVQECLEFSENKTPQTVAYGTDAAHFDELRQAVVYGPGSIAQAHTNDEWVTLADLDRGVETYTQMIKRWCC